jgi:Protein of unknown function (DUF3237)
VVTPALESFMTIDVEVGPPVGETAAPNGHLRLIPLLGGSVTATTKAGELRGRVLPGGADWQELRSDGVLEISARYLLQIEHQGVVEVRSTGLRAAPSEVLARLAAGEVVPPDRYYFRTHVRFRTGVSDLAYLNNLLAVSTGERFPDRVRLRVFLLT